MAPTGRRWCRVRARNRAGCRTVRSTGRRYCLDFRLLFAMMDGVTMPVPPAPAGSERGPRTAARDTIRDTARHGAAGASRRTPECDALGRRTPGDGHDHEPDDEAGRENIPSVLHPAGPQPAATHSVTHSGLGSRRDERHLPSTSRAPAGTARGSLGPAASRARRHRGAARVAGALRGGGALLRGAGDGSAPPEAPRIPAIASAFAPSTTSAACTSGSCGSGATRPTAWSSISASARAPLPARPLPLR